MPAFRAPWLTRMSNQRADVANATSGGLLTAHAGTALAAWDENWALAEKSAVAPDGAFAANVRLERAIRVHSYAGAGGLGAGYTAWASVALFAREGGREVEHRRQVNLYNTYGAGLPTALPRTDQIEFRDPPHLLFFERPAVAPGSIIIGLKVIAFSGGFGLGGASADIDTQLDELSVEWLWRS